MADPRPSLLKPALAGLAAFAAAFALIRGLTGDRNPASGVAAGEQVRHGRRQTSSKQKRPAVLDQLGKGTPAQDAMLLCRALMSASSDEVARIVRGLQEMRPPADCLERALHEAAWRRWFEVDPAAALAGWFEKPSLLDSNIGDLLRGPARSNPAALLKALAGLPVSGKRCDLRDAIIKAVADEAWQSPAGELLTGISDPVLRAKLETARSRKAAEMSPDPAAKTDWYAGHPLASWQPSQLAADFKALAAKDQAAAWQKALALSNAAMRRDALGGVLSQFKDHTEALVAIQTIPDQALRTNALDKLLESMAEREPAAAVAAMHQAGSLERYTTALAAIQAIPDQATRTNALEKFLASIPEHHPAALLPIMDEVGSLERKATYLSSAFRNIGWKGLPADPAALFGQLADGERPEALKDLMNGLPANAPALDSPGAAPLRELAAQDPAMAGMFAQQWAHNHPNEALAWALAQTGESRRAAIRGAARGRTDRDKDGAQKWIDSLTDPVVRFYASAGFDAAIGKSPPETPDQLKLLGQPSR